MDRKTKFLHRLFLSFLIAGIFILVAMPIYGSGKTKSGKKSPPDEKAEKLFEQGIVHYKAGEYEKAIKAMEEAYKFTQLPLILYNIGSAHEKLHNYKEALECFERFLPYASPEIRKPVEKKIINIKKLLEEQEIE